ncbi:MAG: succinate dehydrogenase, cytochrome b556 subunit [Mariprofundus sp.]
MSEQSDSKARPLSPRLSIYRWHPAMIASIAHRITGLILVLFVPLYLWLLHGMTGSSENFEVVFNWMHSVPGRLSLWLVGVALIYHFCNGIRFLCVDAGWLESRIALRNSARFVLLFTVITALALAAML